MIKRRFLIGVSVGLAILTGCARDIRRPPPDPATLAINTVALRIQRELTALRRIQQSQTPPIHAYPIPPGALSTPIQLRWSGRLLPAARAVVTLIGHDWTFRVVGRRPTNPTIVRIDAVRRPAFAVLESLGWQAGRRAGITINRKQRIVEVVYVSR